MTPEARDAAYAKEIRDYLLGRVATRSRAADLGRRAREQDLLPRVFLWWLFEGQRYDALPGRLADAWPRLARELVRLRSTFNPRWKILSAPEGEVDWGRTLSRAPTAGMREYVCRGSQTGLDEDELAALEGWARWIRARWASYCKDLRPDRSPAEADALLRPDSPRKDDASRAALSRWAHLAARSRWPLLRSVVAETLRIALEPQRLDRIPLPSDRAVLFELLCLVRILKAFDPEPPGIRWLVHERDNQVGIPGLTAHLNLRVPQELVRRSGVYGPALVAAMERFEIRDVPYITDLVIRFDAPRAGFRGILVEVKSGKQDYRDTLYQLRLYHAALRQQHPGRWIVWGIAENPAGGDLRPEQLDGLRRGATDPAGEDLWVFSNADGICPTLDTVGLRAAPLAP